MVFKKAWLLAIVLLLWPLGYLAQQQKATSPLTLTVGQLGPGPTLMATPTTYGPGIAMESLANTTLNSNMVSYRFRSLHTGSLASVHFYIIYNHAGYAAGTNGSILVDLETDDGSTLHQPSGVILGSFLIPNSSITNTPFPTAPLTPVPQLVAGTAYHVVFSNQDANPPVNYCSIDAMENDTTPVAPAQLTVPDSDWAELFRCNTCSSWSVRAGYSPILELDYVDGYASGMGYMESWVSSSPVTVTGTTQVREQFTVSGQNQTISQVFMRVTTGGTGSLVATLATASGTVVDSVPLSPASSGSGIGWLSGSFSSSHVLTAGAAYTLTFSSTGKFVVWPIRRGSEYGFSKRTYFGDGGAQESINGGAWKSFPDESGVPLAEADLQTFLK